MPYVGSIGLRGGSIVDYNSNSEVQVGHKSVGHRLTSIAKVFGGNTVTATDIAMAHNLEVNIVNASFAGDISPKVVLHSRIIIRRCLNGLLTG
jgi:hypothetical protein